MVMWHTFRLLLGLVFCLCTSHCYVANYPVMVSLLVLFLFGVPACKAGLCAPIRFSAQCNSFVMDLAYVLC